VQGDEPLIDPSSIDAAAALLQSRPECSMSTLAHAIDNVDDFRNANVVKVVLDANNTALYFSRAPIAWWRDGFAQGITTLPDPAPLRHVGLYAYRVGFLRQFPTLSQAPIEITESLEQLRAMWHGYKIAVHVTTHSPGPGVDTLEDLARVRALFESAA
jgi:3-deoxy-manno-octulosonate cytidylyltransferase (CMP-KDO synthetase)